MSVTEASRRAWGTDARSRYGPGGPASKAARRVPCASPELSTDDEAGQIGPDMRRESRGRSAVRRPQVLPHRPGGAGPHREPAPGLPRDLRRPGRSIGPWGRGRTHGRPPEIRIRPGPLSARVHPPSDAGRSGPGRREPDGQRSDTLPDRSRSPASRKRAIRGADLGCS